MKKWIVYLFCRFTLPCVRVVIRLWTLGCAALEMPPSCLPEAAASVKTTTPQKPTEKKISYFLSALRFMLLYSLDILRQTHYQLSFRDLFLSTRNNYHTHYRANNEAVFTIAGERGGLKLVHRAAETSSDVFSVSIGELTRPVLIRPGTSDIGVLSQVFRTRMFSSLADFHLAGLDSSAHINIIDAGANVGYSSLYFQNLFPHARIIAMEPENGNFQMLKKNCLPFENIIPVQKGLWPKSCALRVLPAKSGEEWNSKVTESNGEGGDIDGISVLDLQNSYRISEIHLFKIDIEGAERPLFSDSDVHDWLSRVKLLCLELHGKKCREAAFDALSKHKIARVWFHDDLVFVRLAAPSDAMAVHNNEEACL